LKVAVYYNPQKPNADTCAVDVCDTLHSHGIKVLADSKQSECYASREYIEYGDVFRLAPTCDVLIAIGGDGTILECAKHIVGSDTKLLGVNMGTLGFMASVERSQLDLLGNLVLGKYAVTPRMLLRVTLEDGTTFDALNDISICRQYAKIFDFNVKFESMHVGSYRADGVIFSTPTGSTAYALSAGGPIIEPDAQCIEMVLVSPHFLGTRPMVFSPTRKLTFTHTCDGGDIYLSVDGNEPINVPKGAKVRIEKSPHCINLIDMCGNTFYASLNEKLNRIRL
jgi:NAD+ kinase